MMTLKLTYFRQMILKMYVDPWPEFSPKEFSPNGNFAERNFRITEFLPKEFFAELNFCRRKFRRTECSPNSTT